MIGVAGLLTLAALKLPLWHIDLRAPQYPEGLRLVVWSGTIAGDQPHVLKSVNNLNHYIGMKPIEPEKILDFKWIPIAIGVLGLLALVCVAAGRRTLVAAWLVLMIVLAAAVMIEFYRWTYDYGHNLDQENAIIKIPGMVYQPPVLGYRKIANFEVWSYPTQGSWVVMGGFLLGAASLLLFRERREDMAHA